MHCYMHNYHISNINQLLTIIAVNKAQNQNNELWFPFQINILHKPTSSQEQYYVPTQTNTWSLFLLQQIIHWSNTNQILRPIHNNESLHFQTIDFHRFQVTKLSIWIRVYTYVDFNPNRKLKPSSNWVTSTAICSCSNTIDIMTSWSSSQLCKW
jgi:hypothetical protein